MRKRHNRGSLQRKIQGRFLAWVLQYYDVDGSRRQRTLGACSRMSKADAERKRDQVMAEVAAERSSDRASEFELFVEGVYLPLCRRRWKPSTAVTSESRIRKHLIPEFGSALIPEIKREGLQAFLDRKASDGLSFSIVNHLRWDLRAIFELAIDEEVTTRNPARHIHTPRGATTRPKRVMNQTEVKVCLEALELRERLMVRLAIFAGMRPGEIFALQWKHVHDTAVDVLQRVYQGRLDTPKSRRSARVVALSDGTKAILDEWRKQQPLKRPDDWVFPSEALKTPLRPENVWRRHIGPQLSSAGLEWVTFQVMRRTYSSLSRKAGADPKVVADQMGHDIGVNLNVYTHADLEQKISGVQTLESYLIQ